MYIYEHKIALLVGRNNLTGEIRTQVIPFGFFRLFYRIYHGKYVRV